MTANSEALAVAEERLRAAAEQFLNSRELVAQNEKHLRQSLDSLIEAGGHGTQARVARSLNVSVSYLSDVRHGRRLVAERIVQEIVQGHLSAI